VPVEQIKGGIVHRGRAPQEMLNPGSTEGNPIIILQGAVFAAAERLLYRSVVSVMVFQF